MKGHITQNGYLRIERHGKYKNQACPFDNPTQDQAKARCGDWCPLFGEAEHVEMLDSEVELSLCKKVLYFKTSDFTDDREAAE